MADTVVGYDISAIQQMYGNYVMGYDGKDRQSKAAHEKMDLFNVLTERLFGASPAIQGELYDSMMECAVEFEESGFIAGFQTALGILRSSYVIVSIGAADNQAELRKETEQGTLRSGDAARDSRKAKASANPEEAGRDKGGDMETISTFQIAEMFQTPNSKVVHRIEDLIFPHLDKQTKRFFKEDVRFTSQHRKCKVYYLNRAACEIYLAEVENYRKYVKIAGGIAKMRELMKTVFPAEAVAVQS